MTWYNRFTNTEKETKRIDSDIIPKIDTVQNSVNTLQNSVFTIQKSINAILVYLKSKDKNMDTSLFESDSPLQLTPLVINFYLTPEVNILLILIKTP